MKNAFVIILVAASLALSGCISALVARASARGREVLQGDTPREAVSAHFGAPETTVPEWVRLKADSQLYGDETWTIWKIKGRPAQADDGGGQATVSALTLGAGEAVMLPMTLLGAGGDALRTFYLIGVFGPDDKLRRHVVFEAR